MMPLTHDHFTDAATHALLAWSAVWTLCGCLAVKAVVEGP